MPKQVMTEERLAQLQKYFPLQVSGCGCAFLGAERASVCEEHDIVDPKQKMLIVHDAAVPTKRELFAAQAMQGIVAGIAADPNTIISDINAGRIADKAVECADALIAKLSES